MTSSRKAAAASVLALALGTLLGLAAPRSSDAAAPKPDACTKYASPSGNDRGGGSAARPFKTAQRLADSLRAGQTGCLRGGVYAESDEGFVLSLERGGKPGAPIRIRSYPGERAKLVGIISVSDDADHVVLSRLAIEGTGDHNTIKIYTSDVVVEDSDITNAGRGKSCMILGNEDSGQAIRTIVRRNRFHDCGSRDHDNKDHGIYVSTASHVQILGNLFWNTTGYSIHFYPDAQSTRVAYNVIDGGTPSVRGGVLFGGNSDYASSDNVVERNVITYAQTANLVSGWDDVAAKGNVARNNCVWAGKETNVDTSDGGFSASGNIVANPRFADREKHNYRMQPGSRCLKLLGFDPVARIQFR